jgi:hypothetical protein
MRKKKSRGRCRISALRPPEAAVDRVDDSETSMRSILSVNERHDLGEMTCPDGASVVRMSGGYPPLIRSLLRAVPSKRLLGSADTG